MSSPTVEVMRELTEILREILIADGYFTDLGKSVHRGFYAHVLKDRGTQYPAVVVHPPIEDPIRVRGGGKGAQIEITVPVVVAAEVGSDEFAYEQLSDCAADTRKAIFSNRQRLTEITNDEALTVGLAEPEMSVDSRFVLTAFTVSVTFSESYT